MRWCMTCTSWRIFWVPDGRGLFREDVYDAMSRRPEEVVALVTGASGAIGAAICRQLAGCPGMEVVLVCRDENKAAETAARIARHAVTTRVRYELADLSRRDSIQALANRWRGPLDLLINNAAIAPRTQEYTPEGIELQLATNVLGYFWMIEAFASRLGAGARIVNVASYWAGGLDLEDLEFERRAYDSDAAYRQSKQADRMLTVAFANRLGGRGISVNACHPGDVNSQLSNSLGFGGHESPDEGARTPVWLATDERVGSCTGMYFEHKSPVRCRFAEDTGSVEALFAACSRY